LGQSPKLRAASACVYPCSITRLTASNLSSFVYFLFIIFSPVAMIIAYLECLNQLNHIRTVVLTEIACEVNYKFRP
jgi:hypothetical protein